MTFKAQKKKSLLELGNSFFIRKTLNVSSRVSDSVDHNLKNTYSQTSVPIGIIQNPRTPNLWHFYPVSPVKDAGWTRHFQAVTTCSFVRTFESYSNMYK